ncbi:MAG: DUF4810 domain-containing protein [Leptothrix sp. (in: b-proteobacteria)]
MTARPTLQLAARALLLGAALALAGCAKPPSTIYYWNGFQAQVYEHFKGDGKGPDEQLQVLEKIGQDAAQRSAKLPPGYRAHLAMVYLKLGRDNEAREALEAEKAAFPESAAYMDFLLKNLKGVRSSGAVNGFEPTHQG